MRSKNFGTGLQKMRRITSANLQKNLIKLTKFNFAIDKNKKAQALHLSFFVSKT